MVESRVDSPAWRWRRSWATILGLVVIAVVFYRAGIRLFEENRWLQPPFDTAPFDRHIDEYAWYHYTYHYYLFFDRGDRRFADWGDGVPAVGQPNVYKFVLGWLLERHGIPVNTSRETMNRWWQPETDDDTFKRFLSENLPFPEQALIVGRYYSAVFSYLTIVLCVVYATRLTNLAVGVVGAVLIANLSLFATTRMMSDSLLNLAFVICFLLVDLIAGARRRAVRAPLIVILSLAVGLTMSIKLTGFLTLAYLPALLATGCLADRTRATCRDAALWSLAHVAIAFSVFVALHPQTYHNPVGGTVRFFTLQLPETVNGDTPLLARAGDELRHQVSELAGTLQRIVPVGHLLGLWIAVVVGLLVLGVGGLLAGGAKRPLGARASPLLVTVPALSILLSHQIDERYTWMLTIVLAIIMLLGVETLSRGAGWLVRRLVVAEEPG